MAKRLKDTVGFKNLVDPSEPYDFPYVVNPDSLGGYGKQKSGESVDDGLSCLRPMPLLNRDEERTLGQNRPMEQTVEMTGE